ncbi:MAG TPA: hypothetical protein VGI96_34895, partial [Streptosporangiaceae bacterium]
MVADSRPAGRWEPAELGVHPAAGPGRPMPAYIRRPHDETLRTMLDPEVAGSRLIVVRGEACTGKSRAAYEAVAARLGDWSLEYPPTAAALAARLAAGIPAWTVLWLGELRRYAEEDGGGAALSGLAELLEGDGHMVITTMWPGDWDAYVTAAGARRGARDPLRVAGRLIAGLDELAVMADPDPARGGVIDVPARFTAEQLTAAAVRGDPVLAAAAGPDGLLTQHLAAGPALLRRYDGPGGDPGGQAVVTAAMDAARLGYAGPLPAAFLRSAAAGYLGRPIASTGEDALNWASALLDGAVRALDPVQAADDSVSYRIAGYLDQHGRRSRQDQRGPASLWDALTACAAGAGVSDLTRIGQAARDRGLYRHAAALWTAAVGAGSADAARRLVAHLRAVSPEDAVSAASWAAGRVQLHDPWDLARLLDGLLAAGAGDAVRDLLNRDPAAQVSVDDPWDAIELLRALHAAG